MDKDKLKCFFGLHDWKITHREYREHEKRGAVMSKYGAVTTYMCGVVKQEKCRKCGKKRLYQFGEYSYN